MEASNNASEFLEFISDNYDMLVDSLMKNGTYDEDVFQDTICKCHDNIVKNNKIIQSHKDFFFWCARNNYIMYTNKQRNSEKTNLRTFIDEVESETFNEGHQNKTDVKDYLMFLQDDRDMEGFRQGIDELFIIINNRIEGFFTPKECMIYIFYMKLKSHNKLTYKKLSEILGISISVISNTINKVNDFVRNDEKIIEEKNKLYE